MSKFNRSWTLQLQTNKDKFSKAFYDVVSNDNKFVLQIMSPAEDINKDFFGSIRNDSFTIWKRPGIFDPNSNSLTLNGNIITNVNSITLNLELSKKFPFNNSIRRFVVNIIITVIFFFLLTRMLWAFHLISDKMNPVYLFVSIPTLFVLGYFFQIKISEMYLGRLVNLYNEVLKRIEQQSNLN